MECHFGLHFIKTAAGHRWRLDVDERRLAGLLGLRVRATGELTGGALKVEGVHRT